MIIFKQPGPEILKGLSPWSLVKLHSREWKLEKLKRIVEGTITTPTILPTSRASTSLTVTTSVVSFQSGTISNLNFIHS